MSTPDAAVAGMFGSIARFYDLLNHVLSFGIDRYWRKLLARTALQKCSGADVVALDLAAGTLDVSLALCRARPDALVCACDFCLPMLRIGLRKLKGGRAGRILPVGADAKRLPLPDNVAHCLTMAFGIRNITPRASAFAEMLRVLKPGGRACILEFGSGRERIWGGLYNVYLNNILPRIGELFSRDPAAYAYLAETVRAFPSAITLEEELRAAGFARVWHVKLTSGIVCLHVGEK